MRKPREGGRHEPRTAPCEHLAKRVAEFQAQGQPVVSVDAKKKELVGTFATTGREGPPAGRPEAVNVHAFVDKELGKVTPYGVYDRPHNVGWVSVGIAPDTAEFAVPTLLRWWPELGQSPSPTAPRLLITAAGGGSHGSRVRLWTVALQEFAPRTGLTVWVRHFPPGTSQGNKIEHRMGSPIRLNGRGRARASRQIIVSRIGETTAKTGLKIRAAVDEGSYPTGREVPD